MEWDEVVSELEKLARKLAVEVRYEPTSGRVGRCVLFGAPVIVLDNNLRLRDRAEGLALMLADLDTEAHYLPDMIRDFLDKRRGLYDNLSFDL